MHIYGKTKAQTAKALLFHVFDQDGSLPAEFHDQDIWFPLSQVMGPSIDQNPSDRMFQPQYIVASSWILEQKAKALGCDWATWVATQKTLAEGA